MSTPPNFVPSSSQTVGPYFRIGLQYLMERTSAAGAADPVTLHGRVLDRDGTPVPDAMLEIWSSTRGGDSTSDGLAEGFRRVGTEVDGAFRVAMARPQPIELEEGSTQAPHLLVLVFARGLLRHLITRVYFEDEAGNASDPVLNSVPAARRKTLIARSDGSNGFRWDVILQGNGETVFFAW